MKEDCVCISMQDYLNNSDYFGQVAITDDPIVNEVWFEDGIQTNGDTREGVGRRIFHDGSIYEGEWSDNKQNGWGRVILDDGELYEGYFKDGWRKGMGKCTHPDGRIEQGYWELNVFME